MGERMYGTTLRGIFPEPKPAHRKNFIKENMRQLKQMQGLIQADETKVAKNDKFRNVPVKAAAAAARPKQKTSQNSLEGANKKELRPKQKPVRQRLEIKQLKDLGEIERKGESNGCEFIENDRITHRGIQTERSDDLGKLYECGVIKYPSPSIINQLKKQTSKKTQDHGDSCRRDDGGDACEKLQNLSMDGSKPDFIKQNMMTVKQKTNRQDNTSTTSNQVPPTYQKGVLPKYLKERKEELQKETPENLECPEGHVLLPEEERKETLRVLRQSYADRIQELNSMPVRNDTLRMRRRKMELEEELRKIDEGIKVFQRPKVFVKIDA